jgi:hypothetical protein
MIQGATTWSESGVTETSIKEKLNVLTWIITNQSVRPEVITEIDRLNRSVLTEGEQQFMHDQLAPIVIEQFRTRLCGSAPADEAFRQGWTRWALQHAAIGSCFNCVSNFLNSEM